MAHSVHFLNLRGNPLRFDRKTKTLLAKFKRCTQRCQESHQNHCLRQEKLTRYESHNIHFDVQKYPVQILKKRISKTFLFFSVKCTKFHGEKKSMDWIGFKLFQFEISLQVD